jgi:uracil permease
MEEAAAAEPTKRNPNLLLDVNESPKKVKDWLLLGIQHVLAMFVACITVPLIVFSGYTDFSGVSIVGSMIAPTIVAAGVGTLFYLLMTKMKSPIFLASSFAYMAPMEAAVALGAETGIDSTTGLAYKVPNLWILPVGMLFVGMVYVIVAFCIKFFGVGWLNKLLPPVVIGPVIMVIGLSLSVSAINNLTNTAGNYYYVTSTNTVGYVNGYNLIYILTGLVAMLVTALCAHYGKKTVSLIPFVLGMLAGYVFASIVTSIGYYGFHDEYFKVVDWSPLVDNFTNLSFTSFLSCPKFLWMQDSAPLTWAEVGQSALLFIPVSFVTICEHIGDHKNLSSIIDRDLLTDPGLTRTLIGDGVATSLSGILCGAANTSYGENVAVVGVTRVASTKVVGLAALMSVLLGFLTPLMCVAETIPACVTGGVSLLLYGFIAASGVKMLVAERIDFGITKNIFVASVILVAGIGGLCLNFGPVSSPIVSITSIAVSMILGIIMNTILRDKKTEKEAKPAEKPQGETEAK